MVSVIRRRRCRHSRAGVCLTIAVIVALGSGSSGQQPAVPQTGAPRQLWPQRPGVFRPLQIELSPPVARQDRPARAPQFAPNEVLVQFRPEVTEAARAAARAAVDGVDARRRRAGGGRLERLTTSMSVQAAIAVLGALPQVEFAEPNWLVYRDQVPNDPFYTDGTQWGMYGDTSTPANEFGSQAGELWPQGFTGSASVYVAVLDEGIDFNHPDLAPNIWTNPFDPIDGIDNDGNGHIDDSHGWDFENDDNSVYDGSPSNLEIDSHGTHVAGIIGARGGDGVGVAGVTWNVTMISGKFLDEDGTGSSFDAALAIDYMIDLQTRHGLNIVALNNSWGGGAYSTALHQAIIRAANAGILFMAAAGNETNDNDSSPHYPSNYSTTEAAGTQAAASYEAVIGVASLTRTGALSGFSNYGASSVDIGAPGSEIYSTLPGAAYGYQSGTSMATPYVAGAAALYKSIHPHATAAQIRSAILSQGAATTSLSGRTATGRRLDVSDFNQFNLTISDVRMNEGDNGTSNALLTVSLSAPKSAAVTVDYATVDGTAVSRTTAATSTAITIPDSGKGSPYPSTVTVPPGAGVVTRVKVVLSAFSHGFPQDVDVLLVGPGGQTCVLMSDTGGTSSVTNVALTFDDAGPAVPTAGTLSSGTYRPTNVGAFDLFGTPAPPAPYGSMLSVFDGALAAGTWSLFVNDDSGAASGTMSAGWSLVVTTTEDDYVATAGTLTFPANSTTQTISVAVRGDTAVEPTETFTVVLGSASGANVADSEGTATIRNDDFTNPSLSGLPVRVAHVVELRTAINETRLAHALPPFAFSDSTLVAQATPIRALHITELRDALAEAYVAAGRPVPVYTDPTIEPMVTVIKAAHISEIRAAVLALP